MKSNFKSKYSLVLFLVVLLSNAVSAQKEIDKQLKSIGLNPITTSVPFLLIAPDSRGGAMGDAGVATSPDATSMHWNASKLAFIEKKSGIAVAYTPWLRTLVPDISLAYLSGFYRISKKGTIGSSLRYFSLGKIDFTDATGQSLGTRRIGLRYRIRAPIVEKILWRFLFKIHFFKPYRWNRSSSKGSQHCGRRFIWILQKQH
jgi:hypothetical protein